MSKSQEEKQLFAVAAEAFVKKLAIKYDSKTAMEERGAYTDGEDLRTHYFHLCEVVEFMAMFDVRVEFKLLSGRWYKVVIA